MENSVSIGAYTPSMNSFTCVSCGLLFDTSSEQKAHFKSDFHRFNLKRKCVGLPPVSEEAYLASLKPKAEPKPTKEPENTSNDDNDSNNEVQEAEETEKKIDEKSEIETFHKKSAKKGEKTKKGGKKPKEIKKKDASNSQFFCLVCDKYFRSPRQFEIHYSSRKHFQRAAAKGVSPAPPPEMVEAANEYDAKHLSLLDMDEEQLEAELARRPRLGPGECLFCSRKFEEISENMAHMAETHSFFVPDLEYCVNLTGLLAYLGEQISVWNKCICCSVEKGCFRSLDAVRRHMASLSHCRMRYDDPSEYAEFYDFDECPFMRIVDEDEDGNPIIDPEKAGPVLADNGYELLLPDGRLVGHRAMSTMYSQNVRTPDWREQVQRTISEERARKRITATPGGVSENALVSSAYTPAFLADMRKNLSHYQEKTKIALDRQSKYQMKLGMKQNKIHILKPQTNV